MSKYTEFRTDEDRIGVIVTGRMSGDENLVNKNSPDKLSVITKDYSERIEDITEWRKVIRNNPIQFVKLFSEWTPPQVKSKPTEEEQRERVKRLKELSYKFNS